MSVNTVRLLRDLRALDITEASITPLSAYVQVNDAKLCCKVGGGVGVGRCVGATAMQQRGFRRRGSPTLPAQSLLCRCG